MLKNQIGDIERPPKQATSALNDQDINYKIYFQSGDIKFGGYSPRGIKILNL